MKLYVYEKVHHLIKFYDIANSRH